MIINHNISALNTHRQLSANNNAVSSSLEKLSSGLKINKAGDDAAGLAISEKMRGQIRGLEMATKNSQDAISLIQTAEGALNETHSILQRMRELAVQSSSDTNTDADRIEMQKEVDQLAQELSRISNDTEFNTQNLAGGNFSGTFHIGANSGQNISISINAMDANTLGVARDGIDAELAAGATNVTGVKLGDDTGTAVVAGANLGLTANDTAANTTWSAADSGLTGTTITSTAQSSEYNGYTITTNTSLAASADPTVTVNGNEITINIETGGTATAAQLNQAFADAGLNLTATGNTTAVTPATNAAATSAGLAADEVALTIGAETQVVKADAKSVTFTSAANKGITLELDGALDASTAATINISEVKAAQATFNADGTINTKAVAPKGIDISTQSTADAAITVIQKAIDTVSSERSKLGAVQNRLEHTINNLGTSAENLTAAESRIRDVDMAKEMMDFTKNNILTQAAQAMLAQANQTPQGVLQLLR